MTKEELRQKMRDVFQGAQDISLLYGCRSGLPDPYKLLELLQDVVDKLPDEET